MEEKRSYKETEFILAVPGAYKMIKRGEKQARSKQGILLVRKIVRNKKI